MPAFIALLRAVSVGGTTSLAMTDLKALCEGLRFGNVRTFIQSGNVVFNCSRTEASVKGALETALATHLGKHTDVLVRSASEMKAILDRNPFPSSQGNQVAVHFFDRPPEKGLVAAITLPGREEIRPSGREVYVNYPDGIGRSKLKLGTLGTATSRNVKTVAKLVAMTDKARRS